MLRAVDALTSSILFWLTLIPSRCSSSPSSTISQPNNIFQGNFYRSFHLFCSLLTSYSTPSDNSKALLAYGTMSRTSPLLLVLFTTLLSALFATAQTTTLSVTTPPSLITCVPASITFSGGTAPYYLSSSYLPFLPPFPRTDLRSLWHLPHSHSWWRCVRSSS